MNQADQMKIMNAGFTIVRMDDHPTIRIKYKNRDSHEFKTLKGDFRSRAERDWHMQHILKDRLFVQD